MKSAASPYDVSVFRRLFKTFVRPYRKKLITAGLLMVVAAVCTALNAWLLQPVIDKVFTDKDEYMLMLVVAAVLAVTVCNTLSSYGHGFIMRCLGQRIVIDMQLALYQHLLHADLAYFGKDVSGKMISRFTNDIQILRASVSTVIVGSIKEFLTFIFLIGVMLYQSVTLTLIVLFVFPVAVYPILRLGKRMRKISHNIQEELGEFTVRLDETFKGIRVIKAYGQEQAEARFASNVLNKLYQLYVKAASIQSMASPIMEGFAGVAVAAVIWYGGTLVINDITTSGKFISFLGAVLMAYKPLKTLSGMNTVWQEGRAAAIRLFDLLDQKPLVVDHEDAKALEVKGPCDITLQNIYFSYGTKKAALNGLDLSIKAGQTIALVGSSGAGKSTVMNLLLRFYDPDKGAIHIDGQDIKSMTVESLRRSIAIVSQETFLFDGTVGQNIAYAKPGAEEHEVIAAARIAAADEFIQELPEGYNTYVGEHGSRLSGGQRQRIAIARAILKDAPILLLDEATSALDNVSERHIKEALDILRKGRTTIVIAHRLSTVMNADCIYVLKKGKVVESGTHTFLIKKGKEYGKLYQALDE